MSQLKSEKPTNSAAPQRRLLVGPGTTVLLLVLMYLCGSQLFLKPKVTIERHVEASAGTQTQMKPSVTKLLSWSNELHLTATQKNAMEKLAEEEKLSLAPVEARIVNAMKEFNEFAEKHSSETVGLKTIQAKAEPMSLLSRQKRQLEQGFAEQAQAILEANQREIVERLCQASIKQRAGTEAASP